MLEMRIIAIDHPGVQCQFVTYLHPAKKAKRIEVLFGVETLGDPRHITLNGPLDLPPGPNPQQRGGRRKGENYAQCEVQERCSHSMRPLPNYLDLILLSAAFAMATVPVCLSRLVAVCLSR